ncbi:hypothetical protein TDMWS_20280 [Thermodesulfomicrobium sp. WS]|uniref:type III secretion apparatus assembly chaperone SctY n=1 Tax=Thermodesulfomicrobium sp. WS TaxID=3004129 RepID=UPI00248FFA2D|nr:hypothetical protein [Thermodesulfomicrobium sp. WS]BDV01943.1 hypothetical protein TDMWS_20280 [Thermodesulfomicrobium sp. WS]
MQPVLTQEETEYLKVVAYTLLRYGKWEKAWALYEALEALVPEDPQMAKGLALAGVQTGRFAQALARVERWLREASSAEEGKAARILRARILWAMGRRDEARESLAMEKEP